MPSIVILAGPNGAGKSTAAATLLPLLGIETFVNADIVAHEISPGAPEAAAFQAGRLVLARLEHLTARGESFAFETTLAGRSYARWLRACLERGYSIHLAYHWLPNADMAVARVARRVATGGHHIPEDVIRRRYAAGIRNLFEVYRPLATRWEVYDSSQAPPLLVAEGRGATTRVVAEPSRWAVIRRQV